MSIRVIVDTTEGTEVEIARVKEIISNDQFAVNKLLQDGIEVVFLGDNSKEIAKANGCTVSVGTNLEVIMGRVPRELAEKIRSSTSAETQR